MLTIEQQLNELDMLEALIDECKASMSRKANHFAAIAKKRAELEALLEAEYAYDAALEERTEYDVANNAYEV